MSFEVFERKVARFTSPSVSLAKQGRLMMNKATADYLRKEGAERVLLLWDPKKRWIGIRSCFLRNDPRTYLIRYGGGNSREGATINAKTFFDYTGIAYNETRAYMASWDDQEKLVSVDISSGTFRGERSA